MFFQPWLVKKYGPKRIDNFSYEDMLSAFTFGMFSVLEFDSKGGNIEDLKDVIATQVEQEIRLKKGGMSDELYEKIDKHKQTMKEKNHEQRNRKK